MAQQIVYTKIPQQQIYTQNPNLVQYNLVANPQGQYSVGGVQYNVANLPAKIANNQPVYTNINYAPNQLYQQKAQQPLNLQYQNQQQIKQKVQQVYPQNIDNSKQYQNQIQKHVQPQIIQQNYQNYNGPRAQINPQQQVQNAQAQQKVQHQMKQQVKNQNQQQGQPGGYLSAEQNYMKYLQKYPNQNANQKINIEYNKKDEHFVNRPIYQERKLPPNPDKNKAEAKKLKTLDDTPTLLQGTKIINVNMKSNLNKQKNQLVENQQKGISGELSAIVEEDPNVSQSGFANK